jgi:hypothetical protein
MEKQNDILLSATLERLYQQDMLAMQQLTTQGLPPEMADLVKKQMRARNSLMKQLLRAFDKNDYERLLAVPDFMLQEKQNAIAGSQQQRPANGVNPQVVQPQGGAGAMVPLGAGDAGGAVPIQ